MASVTGVTAVKGKKAKVTDQTTRPYRATATAWPSADSAQATLTAPTTGTQGKTQAGATPLWVKGIAPKKGTYSGPTDVAVHVQPHTAAAKLGIAGVVFTVGSTDGRKGDVEVGLDYSKFAQAYGGNYASRLHLVQLPACALSTPDKAECRTQKPLTTSRDARTDTVSATVGLTPTVTPQTTATPSATAATTGFVTAVATSADTVLAAAAGTGGGAGSYSATSLSPSGSWSTGGSTGSFTYSYAIQLADASGDLKPTVSLGYDSGSIDGKTASTQAQSSWAGDGWNTPDSFIEQSFASCSDNPDGSASPASTVDMCYDGPVLTLSLNGSSTSLLKDSSGNWTAADGSGEKVTHVTGSDNGTGTYNTDYWTVTDRDGTSYTFGRNQLPGWTSGKATTNSVDSEPVYSAHSGDPCYSAAGFTSSVCTMAYRWHLDYVTDVHGNAMSYWYGQDTNYYGEDNGAHNASYVRDSHLARIDYGFTDGNAFGTVPDQVVFTTAARCTAATCDPISASNAASEYPDVPYDLICASGATCTSYSPSYFSTVRLTSIKVQQYSTAASAYKTVDTYTLGQSEPATGDGTSPTLWLSSLTHKGDDTSAGGSASPITLPAVKFTGTDLQNRVDTTNYPGLYRYRIGSVTSETGGVTSVTYGLPYACDATYVATASPSGNTKSCYPVSWTPKDYTAPITDWFHKYAVTQVLEQDTTGGSVARETDYTYSGGAAWHYDDNEVVKAKYRTWGQFRGYGSVEAQTGDGTDNDPKTESVTAYYRGMDGDWLSSSSTRSVSVTDSQGGAHPDSDQLAGQPLETTVYNGTSGPVDQSTITSYWVSPALATRTRTGLPALTAGKVAPAESWTRQATTDGGTTVWQTTETDTTYDAGTSSATFGLPTYSYTHTVPANTGYDQCTAISYAKANTTLNLVGLVSSKETDSVACSGFSENTISSVPQAFNSLAAPASVNRPARVVSATETFYDDPAFSTTFPQTTTPTKGDATMVRTASDYTGGAFTWQNNARTTYDSYGRVLTSTDAKGNKTTSGYTADSVGLTTGTSTTNAKGQTAGTTVDPTRGLTLTSTDANGIKSTVQYDALGRTTSVWEHNRPTTAPADAIYTYTVSQTGLTGTTTEKLNESLGYATSVSIEDSLGRDRQIQEPTPQGGRLITESVYDSHGWVRKTNNGYWDSSTTPALALVSVQDSQIPDQDVYTFDGQGRTVVDDSQQYAQLKQETVTVYNGDSTTVIPPTGGTVKTTRTDPLGRTAEIDSYSAAPTLTRPANTFTGIWYVTGGTKNAIAYGYDSHNNQATTTSGGSTWTNTYNLLGQAVTKQDPDAGTSDMVYDANGNLTQTTDANGNSVSYTYDVLDRQTAKYAATTANQATSNELASWVYDNDNNYAGVTDAIGQTTTATSYNNGNTYVTQQLGFNVFGESLGEGVTIPAAQGALGGKTYTFKHTYGSATGVLQTDSYPLGGGLPSEVVTHTYTTALDLPSGLSDTAYGYAQNTNYTAYGQVAQETVGMGTNLAYLTNTYDPHTGQLTDQLVSRTNSPAQVDEQNYTYDPSGNITKQVSTRLGNTAATETQCYQYDQLDRLTQAWTATDSCAAAPTTAGHSQVGDQLSGGTAYWTNWSFDILGQRQKQVDHSTTGGTDTTTNYTYDGNGKSQPHTLTSTQASGGSTTATAYTYDNAGNTLTRNTAANGNQTLTWNNTGQLTQISGGKTGTTNYIYDTDGNVLVQTDPSSTTLYLPGQQLTLTGTTTTGVRSLPLPGGGTVVRTGLNTAYSFEFADQHGTSGLYLDSTAQTPAWRQFTPYGDTRGSAVTWLDNRGFLNAPNNANTGLTQLGARQYDPALGRFISLDPIFEATDDQLLNGYSYTRDNPITQADPSGLIPLGPTDGGVSSDNAWAAQRGMTAGYTYSNGTYKWKQVAKHDKASQTSYHRYLANPAHYMIDDKYAKAYAAHEHKLYTDRLAANRRAAAARAAAAAKVKKQRSVASSIGSFLYHASGASDVVGCATNPSWGGCAKAAGTVALTIGTGGEDEVGLLVTRGIEEGVEDGALQMASKAANKAAEDSGSIFVKDKHLSSFEGRYAMFATADKSEAQSWVAEGLRSGKAVFKPNPGIHEDTTFRLEVDMGRTVGTKGQTGIRVVVANDGRVINAFPFNP
ncbi:RHS repeat domain-containing protein [Streptomyces sp. NRRL F-5123]|uniref:RHS repeat domain-containing protein n=1 Tax=Streptomyces sp. NRRL F-5123 TaxID=1463856 RepID=UPI000694AF68|nr:RHS repeat-associated core domain-containing protein [Streptomyces sp. NRRL F-5123]